MQSRLETEGQMLIDANALMRKIDDLVPMGKKSEGLLRELRCVLVRLVTKTPTVKAVEVVHGHWYEHHGITICSHCQSMFDTDLTMLQVPSTWKMPNYCPNCGAKMDGGNDVADILSERIENGEFCSYGERREGE